MRICVPSMMFVLASASALHAEEPAPNQRTYEAGSLQEQLAKDMTPIPSGMASLFVPSLSSSVVEPRVVVLLNGKRIASGTTGSRILVPPGEYEVVVGAGVKEGRAMKRVRAAMGETVVVDSFFGGLRIQAVDADGNPIEVEYTIGRHRSPLSYASTMTQEVQTYEQTPTWLLPAGLYTIALGDDTDTDTDSFVVSVHADELLHYQLVVDDDHLVKADIQTEIVEPSANVFTGRLVIGGDLGATQSTAQPAAVDLTSVRLGGFVNAQFGVDYGWAWVFDERRTYAPFNKIFDDARLELLYNFRLGRIVGPYARALANGAVFPTWRTLTGDRAVQTVDKDGVIINQEAIAKGNDVNLMASGGALNGQISAGIGITAVDIKQVSLLLRVGPAVRAGYYQGGKIVKSDDGSTLVIKRLEDPRYVGGELTAVGGLRLFDMFSYETTLDVFAPFQQLTFSDGVSGFDPIYRWDNTVAFNVSSFFDVFYRSTVWNWDLQAEQAAIYQGVGLRISTNLF
jgi:hypothetical protein